MTVSTSPFFDENSLIVAMLPVEKVIVTVNSMSNGMVMTLDSCDFPD